MPIWLLAQEDATDRLEAVQDLIPPGLRAAVKAGPAEGEVWTLLVEGNAAAAKLRQLSPLLKARLISKGWNPVTLRIKLLARRGLS